MYQVSERQQGKCLLCPEAVEVVELKKDGQTVKLCRTHLWQALSNGKKEPKKSARKSGAEQ